MMIRHAVFYYIHLELLVNFFVECENHSFVMKLASSVSLVPVYAEHPEYYDRRNQYGAFPPNEVNTWEKRGQLCQEFLSKSSLPLMFFGKYVLEPHQYEIIDSTGQTSFFYAIRCPTYPIVYIYSKNHTEDEAGVFLVQLSPPNHDQRLEMYTFDVELVKKIKVAEDRDIRIKMEMPENYLGRLKFYDRYNLCFASAIRLQCKVSFNTYSIRPAQTLSFEDYDGKISTLLNVINCETTPPMYLQSKVSKDRIEIGIMLPESPETEKC